MPENLWAKQRFCSISCSKKKENPMHTLSVREAMAARLREIGHRPSLRGGNGCPPTLTELGLLFLLGAEWEWGRPIPTRKPRGSGWPNHYKLDISHLGSMTCFEVDGGSHAGRLSADLRKDGFLKSLGWSVYRVSARDAERLYTTFRSADTLLTSLLECSSTTAT